MTITPERGSAFLVNSGPGEDQKHLYIVLTQKCEFCLHLAVPIQTVYPGEYYDQTCLLRPGDHPFITHLSCIAYHRSVIMRHCAIITEFKDFSYLIKEPVSGELLEKICNGVSESKRTSKRIRTYFSMNSAGYINQTK
jgi:hypothetical protein